jgi:hypothetical protein
MDAEQLVVDQAFDEIESTPARQHRAEEGPANPHLLAETRCAEQQADADGGKNPSRKMKEPILGVL